MLSRHIVRLYLLAALSTCVTVASTAQVHGQQPSAKPAQAKPEYDEDLSGELPRIPPKTPAEEQATFELKPGFRVELVAAEPLVNSPVAFAFNGLEELFVIEMIDYSEQETEHLGQVAKLVDTDRDGKMDKRTTFAQGLSWPTAIWPWRDGVLVAEPPRVLWLRDTDGDGVADKTEVWFEGFGRSNVQGLVNSLRWSVDGYVHGATSSSGAELKGVEGNLKEALALRGRDFAIDPLTKTVTPTSGGGQHGMAFNSWGDKFVTSNSDHLQQIIDLEGWLSKHASSVPVPPLRRSIAIDGPQAEVYRSSAVEPWRIVRTRLRMSGAVPGVVEGGGRAAGYFTGATGTWIMDASAGFGETGFDTALVCDVGSNLVHRKRLVQKGLFWSGERIDKESELLRGSDIWFRPVQLGDGPDGALYIADMYREVIEHPKSLPPVIKRHLDLTSGRDRGRIWRVVPDTQPAITDKRLPSTLTNRELVQRLQSDIAWQRRMASQLLIEREAKDVQAELESVASSETKPASTILALHVLDRLNQLNGATLKRALQLKHPRVLEHAVRLVNKDRAALDELQLVAKRSTDTHLQLAIAQTAADLPSLPKLSLLNALIGQVTEPLPRALIVIAASSDLPLLVESLTSGSSSDNVSSSEKQREWLAYCLPALVAKLRDSNAKDHEAFRTRVAKVVESEISTSTAKRDVWLDALTQLSGGAVAQTLLGLALADTQSKTSAFITEKVNSLVDAELNDGELAKRLHEVRWLGLLPSDQRSALAEKLLTATTLEPIQTATAESILWADPQQGLELLLPKLRSMTPALKSKALASVLRYNQAINRVAHAIEKKEIAPSEIAPDVRQQLFSLPDKKQQARFKSLLNTASADRVAVIKRYQSAASGGGNVSTGQDTFKRVCAQCHRIGELGSDVGPPLKQLGDKSPDQLLDIILDPNREVDPKFLSYSVLLEDGRVLSGIIREESAGQIVLAEAGGKQHTLARTEITRLQSTGLSLMPVGLEEQINAEQMRDLIAFLKQSGK